MFNPSGTKLPPGSHFELEAVDKGLYAVTNAYGGVFEYFEGKPIPQGSSDANTGAMLEIASIAAKHRPKKTTKKR